MVYVGAAKKTMMYMMLSLVLAFSTITLLSGELTTTANVVKAPNATPDISASAWIIFLLGVLIGALAVGTFTYIVHYEHKRME